MYTDASETLTTVHVTPDPSPNKSTIPPEFKQVLLKSTDYKKWLNLKNNFLRDQAAKNLELTQNIPIGSGNINHLTTTVGPDKFPHFPGSLKDDISNTIDDIPRPERALHTSISHTSPPVYKAGLQRRFFKDLGEWLFDT